MPRKPKFRPEVTMIKLNPEQAVLTCQCFDNGWYDSPVSVVSGGLGCKPSARERYSCFPNAGPTISS